MVLVIIGLMTVIGSQINAEVAQETYTIKVVRYDKLPPTTDMISNKVVIPYIADNGRVYHIDIDKCKYKQELTIEVNEIEDNINVIQWNSLEIKINNILCKIMNWFVKNSIDVD